MKTYWDLSEVERGSLLEEDVRRYVDAELMLKGVLKPPPLELEVVPSVPAPPGAFFAVRFGGGRYNQVDAVFESVADARAFLALRPVALQSEWLGSESVQFVKTIDSPEISEVRCFTEHEKNALRSDLSRAAAVKAANEKRIAAYDAAVSAQTQALKGLWDDWHECRDKRAKLQQIIATFEEYKRIAGDEDIAERFLAKVYEATEIEEARQMRAAA